MHIPRIERETIITFNEAEPTANVYTMNPALQRKLARLAQECPDSVKLSSTFKDFAVEYTVPKKSIKVNKPRKISTSYRAILTENARKCFHTEKEG